MFDEDEATVLHVRMPPIGRNIVQYKKRDHVIVCIFEWIGRNPDDQCAIIIPSTSPYAKEVTVDIIRAIKDDHAKIVLLKEKCGNWGAYTFMKEGDPDDARWIERIKKELHDQLYSTPIPN